jgi:hypothetical protein
MRVYSPPPRSVHRSALSDDHEGVQGILACCWSGHGPVEVLGVEDLDEAIESPKSCAQSCRCLFERLSRTEETPGRLWERLCARSELRRDGAREELEVRRRHEDRLRMLASLPAGHRDDKVIRYEAHLSREFDRTLRQLDDSRRRRA